jgi:uncharacterized protein (TIGR03086 family)
MTDTDRRGAEQRVTRLLELGLDREAARAGAAWHGGTTTTGGPVEALDQLDELAPALGGVIGGIGDDQLDIPTACANFAVRGVLEHMLGGATAFAAGFRGETPSAPDTTAPLPAAVGAALGDLVAAMHEPGALDGTIEAPFGVVPRDTFARFVVLDGLVHGWDLATATGQPYDPPAALVAEVEAFARGTLDPLRDGDTFAAATEAPADATPIERLVAYTGRRVTR